MIEVVGHGSVALALDYISRGYVLKRLNNHGCLYNSSATDNKPISNSKLPILVDTSKDSVHTQEQKNQTIDEVLLVDGRFDLRQLDDDEYPTPVRLEYRYGKPIEGQEYYGTSHSLIPDAYRSYVTASGGYSILANIKPRNYGRLIGDLQVKGARVVGRFTAVGAYAGQVKTHNGRCKGFRYGVPYIAIAVNNVTAEDRSYIDNMFFVEGVEGVSQNCIGDSSTGASSVVNTVVRGHHYTKISACLAGVYHSGKSMLILVNTSSMLGEGFFYLVDLNISNRISDARPLKAASLIKF